MQEYSLHVLIVVVVRMAPMRVAVMVVMVVRVPMISVVVSMFVESM